MSCCRSSKEPVVIFNKYKLRVYSSLSPYVPSPTGTKPGPTGLAPSGMPNFSGISMKTTTRTGASTGTPTTGSNPTGLLVSRNYSTDIEQCCISCPPRVNLGPDDFICGGNLNDYKGANKNRQGTQTPIGATQGDLSNPSHAGEYPHTNKFGTDVYAFAVEISDVVSGKCPLCEVYQTVTLDMNANKPLRKMLATNARFLAVNQGLITTRDTGEKGDNKLMLDNGVQYNDPTTTQVMCCTPQNRKKQPTGEITDGIISYVDGPGDFSPDCQGFLIFKTVFESAVAIYCNWRSAIVYWVLWAYNGRLKAKLRYIYCMGADLQWHKCGPGGGAPDNTPTTDLPGPDVREPWNH